MVCMQTILYFARRMSIQMIQSIKPKGIKKAPNCLGAGGDEWTRTTDSRIFSPMLYQLSYITVS